MKSPAEFTHRRVDILTGREVIVASNRSERPIKVAPMAPDDGDDDPFLEGHEENTPGEQLALRTVDSTANAAGWLVRVVPNRYPAVCSSGSDKSLRSSSAFPVASAAGVHEVVIECPDGRTSLSQLTIQEYAQVLFAWQTRFKQLSTDSSLRNIQIFRNEGVGAGASLPHCHSQILATAKENSGIRNRVSVAEICQQIGQGSAYKHWLESEFEDSRRIVQATEEVAVVCPFASRLPWQLRICPQSENSRFDQLSTADLTEIAAAIISAAKALGRIAGPIGHNLLLTLPPIRKPDVIPWMIDFMPRPARFAGFELMTDVDILIVTPERAAELYRDSANWTPLDSNQPVCPEGYHWRSG